ncbi:MAG TPA: hypothetical protein PLR85_11370 [Nitrospira sp.]|nr:hypothetical protein [Nitrospira sp.]HNC78533.1 hypothetical protein [Rhodocyclaceae bacterium]HNG53973.1 hypothetical protein [Nitrospira sp.]
MAITVNWPARVILSDASITDLPAFHAALRGLEDDAAGAIHPVTHTWKALDLGGGAFFYQADLINGYALEFVGDGPFTVSGNLNGTINDTGVQVERKTSAAYVTTAIGGSGPSAADIAAAVWSKVIEGALTAEQIQRILLAVNAGDAAGLEGSAPLFKSQDGTKNRVVATYSAGSRNVTAVDGS